MITSSPVTYTVTILNPKVLRNCIRDKRLLFNVSFIEQYTISHYHFYKHQFIY